MRSIVVADEVPEGGGDGWDFWIEDGIRDIVLLRVDSVSGIPVTLNLKIRRYCLG